MKDFLCGTPLLTQLMKERWKRLVKEAVRNKGGKVNSIAPEELQRLVAAYLEEHPEKRFGRH
jgi:histone H3/H4